MNWKFWKKAEQPSVDMDAFLAMLAQSYPGRGMYSKLDRYRDFRSVFLNTEEGKRVLYEILGWCRNYRPLVPPDGKPIDPTRRDMNIGKHELGCELLAVIHNQPKDMPSKTTKEKDNG